MVSALKRLVAVLLTFGGLALLAPSVAVAGPLTHFGVCPAIGFADDCNILFIIGPGGVVTAETGPQTTYDGVEDALIGVLNQSGVTINTFVISGAGIFGFDGDGAGSPFCDAVGGAPHPCPFNLGPTGYEGLVAGDLSRLVTFTITDLDNGLVHMAGGLANGESAWFSLEEPASLQTIIRVPEPGTLALLGLAATAFGFSRRRKN